MLLLASGSPRRRDLLAGAGIPFEVRAPRAVEFSGDAWTARELCLANAELKAGEVAAGFPDRIVLGADTIVSLEDRVFGKPAGLSGARAMLEALCGRTHEVLTGVCLTKTGKVCRFIESTRVKFRPRSDVDLDAYLAAIDPLDKAGAYSAQEDEGRLIECIEGSRTNVVGLPMERLVATLDEHFPEYRFHV